VTTADTFLAITAVAAVLGALASWAAVWVNLRVIKRNRRELVQSAWDDVRPQRGVFWPIVRRTYASFRADRGTITPENLDALIGSAGMPPNLPLRPGQHLRNWHDDYGAYLNSDQRMLWEFVDAIYPPRTDDTADVLERSDIPQDDRTRFHEARFKLGTYFQRSREKLKDCELQKIVGHAKLDVLLLSWLELALVRGTRDEGPGKKSQLFEFGNYLCRPSREG